MIFSLCKAVSRSLLIDLYIVSQTIKLMLSPKLTHLRLYFTDFSVLVFCLSVGVETVISRSLKPISACSSFYEDGLVSHIIRDYGYFYSFRNISMSD